MCLQCIHFFGNFTKSLRLINHLANFKSDEQCWLPRDGSLWCTMMQRSCTRSTSSGGGGWMLHHHPSSDLTPDVCQGKLWAQPYIDPGGVVEEQLEPGNRVQEGADGSLGRGRHRHHPAPLLLLPSKPSPHCLLQHLALIISSNRSSLRHGALVYADDTVFFNQPIENWMQIDVAWCWLLLVDFTSSKLVDFDDSLSQFVCKKADFSSEDKKWRR